MSQYTALAALIEQTVVDLKDVDRPKSKPYRRTGCHVASLLSGCTKRLGPI